MLATDLAFAGASEQARRVAAGDVTARALLDAVLDRIARLDPRLGAYRVVLADAARAEADAVDARRAAGEPLGVLAGVPVAIKDDADVAGEATAWGTAAHGAAKEHDGEVVARLRAAGAVVVGKTNVPELTSCPWTESLTFGATRNPWHLGRTPGGSSGGTAAAVAAGLAGLGLGSDGAGSIRMPSAWTGLFGLKPTRDLVPLDPAADAWQGLSVFGPIARHVEDAGLFLDATASTPGPGDGYAAAARAAAPGRLRIALSDRIAPGVVQRLGREERAAWERTGALLRDLGHDVVVRDLDLPASLSPAAMARILRGIADDVARAMPHPERLERRTRALARIGGALPDGVVARARAAEDAQRDRVTAVFDDADVVLTPMAAEGPYRVGELQTAGVGRWLFEAPRRLAYAPVWNVTGLPACSVPAGTDDDGLPVGVQLAAPAGGEALLLGLAAQIEAARPWDGLPPESA